MNLDFPLVTLITPSYNRASFLMETIESVLSQDYPNIEYIVLDDGSTDKTREILEKYSDRLFWESHPNMGEQHTVNKGYQMAKGEFIAIVNSDDPLRPGAVRAAVSLLMENPDALVAYPDYDVIGPDSEVIKTEILPLYDLHKMLLEFNIAMGPGAMIRRKALELIGGRDPKYRYAGDLDFWFRLVMCGKFVHISQVLATHRVHADAASLTGRGQRLAQELIWTINRVFAEPKLPAELRGMRFKIYAKVHHVASWWCGHDRRAKINHLILSGYYSIRSRIEVNKKFTLWQGFLFILKDCGKLLLYLVEYIISLFRTVILKMIYPVIDAIIILIKNVISIFNHVFLKIAYLFIHGIFFLTITIHALFSGKKLGANQKTFALMSSYLPPKWSGGAVIIGRLLKGLNPNLYCLISQYNYNDISSDYIDRLPAKYYKTPSGRWSPSPHRFSFLGKTIEYLRMHSSALFRGWFIAWILKREDCSILVGTTGDLVGVLADFYGASLAGADLYLYYFDDYVAQWWADKSWVNLAHKAETFMIPTVKGYIVPNEYLRDSLIKRHGISNRTVHIVHNPCSGFDIPANEISPISYADGIKILFTGAIYHVNYDSFRNLIQAIHKLNDPRVTLHLYTAQPVEMLIKEGIEGECVVFHSHVPPAIAAEAQEQAGILVLPFTFHPDALGLVQTSSTAKLADYLMTGRPILAIVPPDSYIDWYLNHYECGITVNNDNPAQIANGISRIIQDEELRQRLGRNARDRARIDFNPLEAQQQLFRAIGIEHENP